MDLEDGLNKLLLGRYDEALTAFERGKALPHGQKLVQIACMLKGMRIYAAQLSQGNLTAKAPEFLPAAELKTLQANLNRLAKQLFTAAAGDPIGHIDYMGDLSESLNTLISQLFLRKEQIRYEQDHDKETGLLTRKAFIRGVYDMFQEQREKVGVLFCCALDNITYINEAYGYDSGDLYIAQVVETLRSYRHGSSLLARLSGKEFAVYAHGFNTEESAYEFARNCFKNLFQAKVSLPHGEVRVRLSCGAALYPQDAMTSDTLMNYASHAMFEVQNRNRGTLMRFNLEKYRAREFLSRREEDLDALLEKKSIGFVFQPIVNLRNAVVVGHEALMRPTTPAFSSPLEILSLAEAQFKLHQLEGITFEIIFDWIDKNFHLLGERKIFFNVASANYLYSDELEKIHPEYIRISKHMAFEILENACVENTLLQRVSTLRRDLAVLVAIDDFGCGHSNANRLISIAPDILKIDRFFINNIDTAPASKKKLLSNILDYCRANRILSVAEGVETSGELESVIRMGFDYAQGFYLGRPASDPAELDPRLASEVADLGSRVML